MGLSQYRLNSPPQLIRALLFLRLDCQPQWHLVYLLTCTCVGIHSGRVETASPIALTTSRTEALQTRWSCASSLDTFTQSFLHRAWPKTRGLEIGSRSALIVVAHVFSWPPARLRHVRGGVGRRRSLISSPSRRLATCPNRRSLLCTSSAGMLVRQRRIEAFEAQRCTLPGYASNKRL